MMLHVILCKRHVEYSQQRHCVYCMECHSQQISGDKTKTTFFTIKWYEAGASKVRASTSAEGAREGPPTRQRIHVARRARVRPQRRSRRQAGTQHSCKACTCADTRVAHGLHRSRSRRVSHCGHVRRSLAFRQVRAGLAGTVSPQQRRGPAATQPASEAAAAAGQRGGTTARQ